MRRGDLHVQLGADGLEDGSVELLRLRVVRDREADVVDERVLDEARVASGSGSSASEGRHCCCCFGLLLQTEDGGDADANAGGGRHLAVSYTAHGVDVWTGDSRLVNPSAPRISYSTDPAPPCP